MCSPDNSDKFPKIILYSNQVRKLGSQDLNLLVHGVHAAKC